MMYEFLQMSKLNLIVKSVFSSNSRKTMLCVIYWHSSFKRTTCWAIMLTCQFWKIKFHWKRRNKFYFRVVYWHTNTTLLCAVYNTSYHKYPPSQTAGSKLLRREPMLISVRKWGIGGFPVAPFVCPTLGRWDQDVAQCCSFNIQPSFRCTNGLFGYLFGCTASYKTK